MIILDTNVISELIREAPDERVKSWITSVRFGDIATTSVTIAELLSGAALMPQGKKRVAMEGLTKEIVADLAGGRIESSDEEAAEQYALVLGRRKPIGRPIGMADAMIEAICLSRNAVLATRNVKDFDGLDITMLNPWEY
jgi:toxin FitB